MPRFFTDTPEARVFLSHFNKLVALFSHMGSDGLRPLLDAAKAGDQRSLAKVLSQAESLGAEFLRALPELFEVPKPVFRIGITGPPGAGKSTLIANLIQQFRAQNLRLGVLAVDPSSPFSQGAILGDRIRYADHFLDPNVFIRSLGTRGCLGGLSSAAYLMLRVFDHMSFDLVLIETVGVGQTELEIVNVADVVVVVLVPESGDSIQAMKAGLPEIADLFVVNKADRPGADALAKEIEALYEKPVLKTSATQGIGVNELVQDLLKMRRSDLAQARTTPSRLRQEAMALLRADWETEIKSRVNSVTSIKDFREVVETFVLSRK